MNLRLPVNEQNYTQNVNTKDSNDAELNRLNRYLVNENKPWKLLDNLKNCKLFLIRKKIEDLRLSIIVVNTYPEC